MNQKIILALEQRTVGQLLSTDAKTVIPRILESAPVRRSGAFSPPVKPQPHTVIGDSVMLCGAFSGSDVIRWIGSTAKREYNRRDVTLSVIDQLRKTGTETEMFNCLMAEVTLPALNKASTADAVMRLVVKAERLRTTTLNDVQKIPMPPSLLPWRVCDFEFAIDGLDTAGAAVQTVEPLVFKQGYKSVYRGQDRLAENEPTKIEDSNIVITLPIERGKDLLDWFEAAKLGKRDRRNQKTGRLRYLTSRKTLVVSVNFYELSPLRAVTSGHLLRVEMACGWMDFEGASIM